MDAQTAHADVAAGGQLVQRGSLHRAQKTSLFAEAQLLRKLLPFFQRAVAAAARKVEHIILLYGGHGPKQTVVALSPGHAGQRQNGGRACFAPAPVQGQTIRVHAVGDVQGRTAMQRTAGFLANQGIQVDHRFHLPEDPVGIAKHRLPQQTGFLAVDKGIGGMLHHQFRPAGLYGPEGGRSLGKRHHVAQVDQREGHLPDGVFHALHQIVEQKRMAVARHPGKTAAVQQSFFFAPAQPDADFVPAQIPRPMAQPFHGRHLSLKFGNQGFLLV